MLAHVLRAIGGALLPVLVTICALASPASAHTTPYSVVVSPSSVTGGQRVTFTATFTNRASEQKLGSAKLTAPFGVFGASVPAPGSATVSGNVVLLRNLALRPTKSVAVTVVADVPCSAGTLSWAVKAKPTSDFSGYAELGPIVQSSLTTAVTGGCAKRLRFLGNPASARAGEAITTTPFNVPPGAAPTVEVVDGAGRRVTSSNVAVTLTLAPVIGTGLLTGTTSVTAVNGLATFGDLAITAQGSYVIVASSPGLDSATTSPIRIDEAATVCIENLTCAATLSNPAATLAVSALSTSETDTGVLVINRNIGPALDCAGYTEVSDGDFAVDFLPGAGSTGRAKVVTATITKEAMNRLPENGAAHLNMCFGAPFVFAVKPGTPPLQQPEPGLLVGLLPDCGTFSPPCVSKRQKANGAKGVIEVRAPGGAQDPRYGP